MKALSRASCSVSRPAHIAVWEGYNAIPTAEGVGRATTRTVVITAIAILVFDFMITAALI